MGSVIGYREAHGSIATFETNVAEKIRKIEVDIEPVQDLHGYDAPWPAGGGKNLLDPSKRTSYGSGRGQRWYESEGFTLKANQTYTFSVTYANPIALYIRDKATGDNLTTGNSPIMYTPTADTAVYFQAYRGEDISSVDTFQLELGSTATTFAPYSNICPITGWTGANITHHGKNMAQYWQNAYIGADGSIKTGSTYAMAKPVFVQNGRSIAVSNTAGDYQGIAVFSDSSLENMLYRLANTASTYIAEQDCYIVFWFNKVYSEYTQSDFVSRGVQIEFSYNPTNFEPYKHDEYDITFPSAAGTVYGGTLDVVKGELVVDRAMVDLGTLTWNRITNPTGALSNTYLFYARIANSESANAPKIGFSAILSTYKWVNSYIHFNEDKVAGYIYNVNIAIRDDAYTDATTFKSAMSGVQLVYELATPITYQLTPQEVRTIIGTNTIYADTGDTSVIYPKTITPVETVSNASLMELRRNIMMAMQHNYIPDITTYGVEWNYSNPSTVLTRTGNAANFSDPIPAESLSSTGSSPFDNIYPWSEMKRYNIINGEVAYSEDDAGYSETDYDTVVYIPEFYYKAEKDTINEKWNWSISSKPAQGYEKHPGSGRYVGRFHTSGSSSGVFSKGGVTPLASTTRANFRTYSHNKGSNWWQIDLATWSAIQILYLVEFANWNSQSVLGKGQNSGSVKNTGATTGAAYHTLKQTGAAGNMYRWIENPFSNVYTFVDGYVASRMASYITTNPTSYGESTTNMENAGITLPKSGYITGLGYSEKCAWAFIPNAASGGSASTYIPDHVYSNSSGTRALYVGGDWNASGDYGAFYFSAYHSTTNANAGIGSRLIYIPTT